MAQIWLRSNSTDRGEREEHREGFSKRNVIRYRNFLDWFFDRSRARLPAEFQRERVRPNGAPELMKLSQAQTSPVAMVVGA